MLSLVNNGKVMSHMQHKATTMQGIAQGYKDGGKWLKMNKRKHWRDIQ